MSEMITRMHEIFSNPQLIQQNSIAKFDSTNLRSLMGAIGTVQFPSHHRVDYHKLVTPPRPKWWSDSINRPFPKLGSARFKFERSSNPVWRVLNEKSSTESI